jgi:primosomal protein N'
MRVGATKVAQDLSTLLRQDVGLVDSQKDDLPQNRVVVGTEALLRRSDPVGRVAFIDFDQELYGSRISSDVRACGLLALAHRLVGGSRRDGAVLIQTSMPQHPVVEASVAKDISTLTAVMSQQREVLNLPPFSAIARIEGAASPAYVDALKQQLEHVDAGSILRSVDVASTGPDQWLVRAPTEAALSQALRLVARSDLTTDPGARLRIAVNPVDL